MAKKERNKRAARKARQEQRKLTEASVSAKTSKKAGKASEKKVQASAASKKTVSKKSEAQALQKKAQSAAKSKKDRKQSKSFFRKIASYFSGVRQELKRVVWPTRRQLVRLTIAVLLILFIFGVCVWALDTGSSNVVLSYINTFREATTSG